MMRTSKKYNYKLIRMKKTFLSLLITFSLFNFFNANYSRAQSLEIVFKNSVWGAGIVATLGVAACISSLIIKISRNKIINKYDFFISM